MGTEIKPESIDEKFELVPLANRKFTVRNVTRGETFHPVVGPETEARALYLDPLRLRERLAAHRGEFVIWDVGLGAAGNPATIIRECADLPCRLRILSFDRSTEPLRFALAHVTELSYLAPVAPHLERLLQRGSVEFVLGRLEVVWQLSLGDFPTFLAGARGEAQTGTAPTAILFDPYSPARNPEMWTLPLFNRLYQRLYPGAPALLATYSRSTMLRVTLLLAGFFVGAGGATGEKDQTTVASNRPELLASLLDRHWLERAYRSTSAEPLTENCYRQAPMSNATREKLLLHPQFS